MSGKDQPRLAFVGFGEAAMAFADGLTGAVAYDRKTDAASSRQEKLDDFARLGVAGRFANAEAIAGVPLVLSLVTADRALAAAAETARGLAGGAFYCDMNSVAPATKRAAAVSIEAAGGLYVDVAVMAPVLPKRCAVPLLLSGPHAEAARAALLAAGFRDVRALTGPIGAASCIKMLRSVMVKGLEALTTECVLAAERAGVLDEVVASLNASWPGTDWAAKADYNIDRMIVHGARRAEEMQEVVATLDALATGSAMSRATAERQRAIGGLGLDLGLDPRTPLAGKIAAILLGDCEGKAA